MAASAQSIKGRINDASPNTDGHHWVILLFIHFEELKEAFDTYDVDKSEAIDINEVKKVLDELGLSTNDKDVEEMFKELDRNNDGKVTFMGKNSLCMNALAGYYVCGLVNRVC